MDAIDDLCINRKYIDRQNYTDDQLNIVLQTLMYRQKDFIELAVLGIIDEYRPDIHILVNTQDKILTKIHIFKS